MADNNYSLSIRKLIDLDEYKQCEVLQQTIWQASPIEVAPSEILITIQRHGGLVLGAFDETESMTGFIFGFLGYTAIDNPLTHQIQIQHCSHAMGIVPERQGQGIGYQLKLAQREHVIRQGIDLITWTYDPLEIPNAILNFQKLGVISQCYLPDLYGNMPDFLNADLPSDRFEVVWAITSDRVNEKIAKGPQSTIEGWEKFSVVNQSSQLSNGLSKPSHMILDADDDKLLVQAPNDFQRIKKQDNKLALDWRLSIREIFQKYFKMGYAASAVIASREKASFYYLIEPADKIK